MSPSVETFNEVKYKAMMDGLECSEINLCDVKKKFLRIDAEYYQKDNLILENIIEAVQGKTISSHNGKTDCSAFYPSITEYYSGNKSNIPFLRVNEIVDGLVAISEKTVFLPERILKENSKTIALTYPGDIIIAKGGNTLAKVGLVTDEYSVYATCRDVIILRTDEITDLNKFYLWAYLHSSFGQKMMWRSASQTGQPHLTLNAINDIRIPECSNALQETIEELYKRSVYIKRTSQENYEKAANILKTELGMLQIPNDAVSIKKFSETFKTTGRLDAEYYQPKYDILLDVLQKFSTKKLGGHDGIVDIKKSIEPGSDAYKDNGIPFVRVSDISKYEIKHPEVYLSQNVVKNIDTLFPSKDTILFSKDGSVGIAYRLERDENIITSSALLHLTIKNESEILPDYLTLVLNSDIVQMQAERDSNGAIIQHWKPSEIENVVVPVLEMEQQKKIVELVQKSFALRKQSKQLLEDAKCAVEMAIEQGENIALKWLESKMMPEEV